MPVIINEFEVVSQTPTPQQGGETPPTPSPTVPVPTPYDFEVIIQHINERLARLWAD